MNTTQPSSNVIRADSVYGSLIFDWDVVTVRTGTMTRSHPIEGISDITVKPGWWFIPGELRFLSDGAEVVVEFPRADYVKFQAVADTMHHALWA